MTFRAFLESPALLSSRLTCLLALGLVGCAGPDHGPYWDNEWITPNFTVHTDDLSTTFEGRVHPVHDFVLGVEDGVAFTTPNVRLTVDMAAVWAYAPIRVGLYSGAREQVGSDETLISEWVVEPPSELNGSLTFQESHTIDQQVAWVSIQFEDFSGQCVFQLLGHH